MPINDSIICVDNTDPSIKWDGPWFSTQNNTDDWGNAGPPFLSTLQAITRNGSFSFSYRGMLSSVYGRNVYVWGALRPRNNSEGGRDPDWECFIDGIQVPQPVPYPTQAYSTFALCTGGDNMADGDHTFELKAIVVDETLWVDLVQYRGSIDTDVSTDWTEVRQRDERFKYSNDWKGREGTGYGTETTVNGAWFTYEFNGQGAILGGYTPGNSTALDGSATYSLDNGPPIAFTIPATAVNKSSQPYFSITDMKPGPHRLEVINKGNDSTAPLAFSYIYTKNAPPAKSRTPSKVIGGAAVGGIAAAILVVSIIFVFLRIRRRRRRDQTEAVLTPIIEHGVEHGVVTKDYSGPHDVCYMEVDPGPGRSQPQPPAFLHQSSHALLPQTVSVNHSSLHQTVSENHSSLHQTVSENHSSLHLLSSQPSPPPPAYATLPSHPHLTFSEKKQSPKARVLFTTGDRTSPISPSQSEISHPSTHARAGPGETIARPDGLDTGSIHALQTMDGKVDESDPYSQSSTGSR